MPNKPKIELDVGESVVGTLLNDTPYEGNNSNGKYYMYSLNVDGVEKVHFASDFLHPQLKKFSAGDVVEISHKRKDDGGSVYNAKLIGKEEKIKGSSSNTDLAIKWGMAFNNATRIVIAKHGISESMGDNNRLVQDVKDLSNKLFEVACSMPTQPDEDPDSLPWD